MQNIHMLSIILKHDFLTSYNFTSFLQTDIAPGNYLRKNPIISLFFHQISPSNAVICVHFSNFNNNRARRRNGSARAETHQWLASAILRAEAQLPGPVSKHGIGMGSLQALLQKVKRLLLQTATTWGAGRETCVGFWTLLCLITSRH